MTADPTAGGGGTGGLAGFVATVKELWQVILLPFGTAAGGLLWRWYDRRDKARAEAAAEARKGEDAFARKFDRLDARAEAERDRAYAERDRANARADAADARADAAERERWRMELWARDFDHALGNARQIADDARARADMPPLQWRPVPRPALPGDPP